MKRRARRHTHGRNCTPQRVVTEYVQSSDGSALKPQRYLVWTHHRKGKRKVRVVSGSPLDAFWNTIKRARLHAEGLS